jgi:hypothetical protein
VIGRQVSPAGGGTGVVRAIARADRVDLAAAKAQIICPSRLRVSINGVSGTAVQEPTKSGRDR